MTYFSDDDQAYTDWLTDHPNGFVVNVRRTASPSYMVLHRAICRHIATERDDGAYTGRGYRKIVSTTLDDLRAYARSIGRGDGSFSQTCRHCAPS